MTTKTAKIHWCGSFIHVYDEETPQRDLFSVSASAERLIPKIQSRAAKLGYSVPQIYAGKDGIVRIWL